MPTLISIARRNACLATSFLTSSHASCFCDNYTARMLKLCYAGLTFAKPSARCWLIRRRLPFSDTSWGTLWWLIYDASLGGDRARVSGHCFLPLSNTHTHTTFQTASVLPVGAESVDHVHIVSPTAPAARLPRDCATIVMDGGFAGPAFFVRYYVDDGVLVEAKFFQDSRRCRRAVQSLASSHFRLLGTRGPNDPPLLSKEKITDFNTRLEVPGWMILDTQQLTVTMPAQKQQKLIRVLGNWPATRTSATARQVSELTGFLMHVCFALRPGNFSWGGHWPQLGCHNLPCFRLVCPNPTAAWCWGLCFTRTWIFGDGSKRGGLLRVAGLCVCRCTILCNGPQRWQCSPMRLKQRLVDTASRPVYTSVEN